MFQRLARLAVLAIAGVQATSEITKWNNILLAQVAATKTNPPTASRMMALLHVSQFEAVNAFDGEYYPWLEDHTFTIPPGATPECAAASAGREIMYFLWPANQTAWDAQLTASFTGLTSGEIEDCTELGTDAAAAVVAARTGDGSATAGSGYITPSPYIFGDWRPTLPANASYMLPNWRLVTPWSSADIMDIAGSVEPPELNSQQYLAELDEVRRLGFVNSTERTADESKIAKVWEAGSGTVTPPGMWFQIAQQLADAHELTLQERAHLFARLGMAVADAAIVCWQTKFATTRWRPITALRLGDYPTWMPYLTTPPFPAHTSGHSTFSAAACVVLATELGGLVQPQFTVTGNSQSLNYTNLETATMDAARSRVYGGIHYQSDSDDGVEIGMEIGTVVSTQHILIRPLAVNDTSSSDNSSSTDSSATSSSSAAPSPNSSTAQTVGFVALGFGIIVFVSVFWTFRGTV